MKIWMCLSDCNLHWLQYSHHRRAAEVSCAAWPENSGELRPLGIPIWITCGWVYDRSNNIMVESFMIIYDLDNLMVFVDENL